MGLGREVADAYISVHGDLSPFRRDLSKANKDIEKAAKNDADTYAEAWGKRLEKQTKDRWNSIVDTMYGQKKIDVNKMIEHFDPTDIDNARDKINQFLLDMSRNQHLTGENYKQVKRDLNDAIDGLKERNKLEAEHQQLLLGDSMAQDANNKLFAEANKENERWARTLDGIRKNNAIKNMESDFRRLAETMNAADMGKFAKSFDNLHQARARIYEITAAMQQQGRMSQEQADIMHANINQFIEDEKKKSKAMKDALDETNRLRKAQDDYNNSLNGMARNIHFSKLENDFRNLAAAMDSNDFSHFANGARDIDMMRNNIMRTATEMHRLGRMSDNELALISRRAREVTHSFDGTMRGATLLANAGERLRGVFGRLGGALQGTREHLQGFAGLNVFGDMIREGLDFIHNLDRIALSASNTALKIGSIASIGGSALASLSVILQDLGQSLSGFSALLPAFATGFGFMAYVGMTALQGMAEKYKKELKQWKEDMFAELNKGLQPAMDRFSTVMLPTLQKNLKATAAAEGRLFGAILDGITKSTGPDKMNLMFKRMNDAMDKSHTGVKAFVDAWARLGLVGSKYFGRFADWINKLGTQFDKFITKAEKSGQIDKWIEKGIKGFKDLGRTIDGTMGIFNAIADAARKAGAGGLSSFADKLQNIAKAMQEAGYQKTLVTMFEGMEGATKKVGIAIGNLGPAVASVMPSIKQALLNIGDVASTVIGYIGDILNNPAVQKGIVNFTEGMKTAIEHLGPAIKPFADSLGNAMNLLGKVIVSVADIATAFTVVLGPVLDDMSRKVQTLLTPLSNMAVDAVKALKPVADAINNNIVGPLVEAMKAKIIPAVSEFVGKAGPFLQKVVTDLGPSFKTLVNDVLPNAIKFAGELLGPLGKVFDLFTPTLESLLKKIGDGFGSLASAMRIAKGEARPEDWGILFHGFTTDGIDKSIKDTETKLKNIKKMGWGEIFSQLFTGDMSLGLAGIGSKFQDFFTNTAGPFITEQIGQLVAAVGGLFGGPGDPKLNALSDQVDAWIAGAFGNLFDNILPDLQKNNEGLSNKITTALNDWWGGIKGMFQDWFKSTFGFGNDSSKAPGGSITGSGMGGGGAGGKGSGIMGKITDEQLGIATDPSQQIQQWFTDAGTNIGNGLQQLSDMLGLSGLGQAWADFWNGFGTTVSTAWDGISTWISTKYTEISAGISGWLGGLGGMWNDFWSGFGTTVSTIWTQITTWISTQIGVIGGAIGSWIGGLGAQWNGFWGQVGQKVSETWTQMTTWISTQVGAIGANISGFIGQVSGAWNGFWGQVGAKVSQTWSQMTGWISGQIGAIAGRIGGFIGQVTGSWNSFWGQVGQRVSSAWQGIQSGVQTGISTVIGFISGLPGKITGALGDLWGLLTGAGNAIMGGLQRGLEAAWSGVKDFVGGVAQWIKDHKGPISYDRTLLVPAGEAIMGGFNASLQNKFGDVMDFISSIADTMSGVFAHSKMYVMGADAALGLADGFSAGKTSIAAAVGSLSPDVSLAANISGAYGGVGGPTPAGAKVVNIAAGAIQVNTPTQSPELVASKTIDALVSGSNF